MTVDVHVRDLRTRLEAVSEYEHWLAGVYCEAGVCAGRRSVKPF